LTTKITSKYIATNEKREGTPPPPAPAPTPHKFTYPEINPPATPELQPLHCASL